MNFSVQHRLAALVDRPVQFEDLVRKAGDDLTQRAADMSTDRQSIDLRHMLVDAHETMVTIHEVKTHRRVPVDLLDFVEYGLTIGYRGAQFGIRGDVVEPQSHSLDDPVVDVASHQCDDHRVSRQQKTHGDRGAVSSHQITNDLGDDGR